MKILSQNYIANIELDDNGAGLRFLENELSDIIGISTSDKNFGAWYLGVVSEDYEDPIVQDLLLHGATKARFQTYRHSLAKILGFDAAECREAIHGD